MHPPRAKDAVAFARYHLDGKYQTFAADAGIQENMIKDPSSPVTFCVLGDGRELWKSPPLQKRGESAELSVDVRGVKELRLEASSGEKNGNCHATWFMPRLTQVASAATTVAPQPAPPLAKAPFDAIQAKAHQAAWAKHLGTKVETVNSVGQKMILIPPGEFMMGSSDEQVAVALKMAEELKADQDAKDRIEKRERPQHKVSITKPFLLSATEVTIGQFKKFAAATGYQTEAEKGEAPKAAPPKVEAGQPPLKPIQTYLNPGYAVTDDSPAAFVTWNDAVAYCEWLTRQESGRREPPDGIGGLTAPARYRLPTEAEWEYASRAGTTTQYSFGDDYNELPKYGWHKTNAGGKSHPVGTLLSNPFGLFDMHGNLQEWCGDFFDEKWYEKTSPKDPIGPSVGSSRVLRGGRWNANAYESRSAYRNPNAPSSAILNQGFRCVMELSVPAAAASAKPSQIERPTVSQIDRLNSPDYEWTAPESLGPEVNVGDFNNSPYVAPDGLSLWFSVNGGAKATEQGQGDHDLWIARRRSLDAPWEPAVNAGTPINHSGKDMNAALSADSLDLVFWRYPAFSLFESKRATTTALWTEPVRLTDQLGAISADPYLSRDGLELYYSLANKIHHSARADRNARWGKPTELASLSGGLNAAPIWVSPDGRSMLGSWQTNRSPNIYEYWLAKRSTTTERWSAPQRIELPESIREIAHPSPVLTSTGVELYFHLNKRIHVVRRVPKSSVAIASDSRAIPADALTFGGHRYLLVDAGEKGLEWGEAKARAEAMGGHLVVITSQAEYDWVRDEVWLKRGKTSNYYERMFLGATKSPHDAEWKWVTGEPLDRALWTTNYPGESNEDKVLIWVRAGAPDRWHGSTRDGFVAGYYLVEWDTLWSKQASTSSSTVAQPPAASNSLDRQIAQRLLDLKFPVKLKIAGKVTGPRWSLHRSVLLPFGLRPRLSPHSSSTLRNQLPKPYSHNPWYKKRGHSRSMSVLPSDLRRCSETPVEVTERDSPGYDTSCQP
jgi:formylglycine-generating enzyme required for sulfatase activity